jgi:mRNA-degrading endonuclease HigB of HigAB toxin-antitoxin module
MVFWAARHNSLSKAYFQMPDGMKAIFGTACASVSLI